MSAKRKFSNTWFNMPSGKPIKFPVSPTNLWSWAPSSGKNKALNGIDLDIKYVSSVVKIELSVNFSIIHAGKSIWNITTLNILIRFVLYIDSTIPYYQMKVKF